MINPMEMTGKCVLVTGASSGIGRATARLLSELGARLVLVGRDRERLQCTADMLEGSGHCIEAVDLAKHADLPRWFNDLLPQCGPLSALVHSAGVALTRPFRLTGEKDLRAVMQINFDAAFRLAQGFRQKKVCLGGGSIVFVASVAGLVGQPGIAAYSASKGALIALSRALAMELARDGIRVNCVAPGHVQTEMADGSSKVLTPEQVEDIARYHPLGVGSAEDVAHAIAFLVAKTGRWITGTTIVVDGGYTAH